MVVTSGWVCLNGGSLVDAQGYHTFSFLSSPGGFGFAGGDVLFRGSETVVYGGFYRYGGAKFRDSVGARPYQSDMNNLYFECMTIADGVDENFSVTGTGDTDVSLPNDPKLLSINNVTLKNILIGPGNDSKSHAFGGLLGTYKASGISLSKSLYMGNRQRYPEARNADRYEQVNFLGYRATGRGITLSATLDALLQNGHMKVGSGQGGSARQYMITGGAGGNNIWSRTETKAIQGSGTVKFGAPAGLQLPIGVNYLMTKIVGDKDNYMVGHPVAYSGSSVTFEIHFQVGAGTFNKWDFVPWRRYESSSSDSLTIKGTGTLGLTIDKSLRWKPGRYAKVYTSEKNWMAGAVISYDESTGALSIELKESGGSGTFANWTVTHNHLWLSGNLHSDGRPTLGAAGEYVVFEKNTATDEFRHRRMVKPSWASPVKLIDAADLETELPKTVGDYLHRQSEPVRGAEVQWFDALAKGTAISRPSDLLTPAKLPPITDKAYGGHDFGVPHSFSKGRGWKTGQAEGYYADRAQGEGGYSKVELYQHSLLPKN